ncbi:hypothetical protein [Aquimarina algicola]|nr:hypothetical protein [Aquimarina algicola]
MNSIIDPIHNFFIEKKSLVTQYFDINTFYDDTNNTTYFEKIDSKNT